MLLDYPSDFHVLLSVQQQLQLPQEEEQMMTSTRILNPQFLNEYLWRI